MKTISILGSGWLGLPLADHLVDAGYTVKASTRQQSRIADIAAVGAEAFLVDIDNFDEAPDDFFDSNILIINITSKNIDGFRQLVTKIENSTIKQVLFVSSTSVYENVKATVTEADTRYHSSSPLLVIEDMLSSAKSFDTTLLRFGGLIDSRRHHGRFFASGRAVQNADTPVNLIHFDDCLQIISQIINQGCWGETLNACADSHPSKREFYGRAIALYGVSMPEFVDSDSEVGKVVSNARVKQLLQYEFKHPDLMVISFD